MRRLSFVMCWTVFFSAACACAHAQVFFDIKGGLAAGQLFSAHESASTRHYQTGFSIPGALSFGGALNRHFSVHVGIGYDPTGVTVHEIHALLEPATSETLYTDCESQIRLHYLSFSALVRYAYPISRNWSLFLEAGASPQFLITAHQEDEGYGTVYDEAGSAVAQQYFDQRKNIRKDFYALNAAVRANSGLIWNWGNEYALLELGANRGLSPVERNTDTHGAHTTGLYYLEAGYGFIIQRPKFSSIKKGNCHKPGVNGD